MTNVFSDYYPFSERAKRIASVSLVAFVGLLAARACSDEPEQQTVPPMPVESTVFDGTVSVDGRGDWEIQCSGEQYVPLYPGSTFSTIVSQNVEIVNPVGLGQQSIPLMAVVEASADVAGVENPSVVQADQSYLLPLACEQDVVS